jgi:hypothetical protein
MNSDNNDEMVDKGRALGFWGLTSDEEVLLLHVEVELVAWCRSSAQGQEVALLLPTVDVGVGTQRGR